MAGRGRRARSGIPGFVGIPGLVGLVGLVLAVLGAHPARASAPAAGRSAPDIALVIEGGTGRTTALHSGERDFTRLWDLLTPTYMGTERVPDAWTAGDFPPVRATVVWGLSGVGGWPQTDSAPGADVAMGRQDQLFLAADGTPWVRTDPSPDVVDDDIRWHRASRSVYERVVERGSCSTPPQAHRARNGVSRSVRGGCCRGWERVWSSGSAAPSWYAARRPGARAPDRRGNHDRS